ncbi:MAG: DMT family transporter [Candidatus Thorarchaeota archaeon]
MKINPGIEWIALLTAFCWGAGSFFGKRAMKIGHLSPLVGIVLRTFTAFLLFVIFLAIFGTKINIKLFDQIKNAWKKSKIGLFQIILFEGILAGGIGMFLYYLAISGGALSLVMPLAFISPFWGSLLTLIYRDEKISFNRTWGFLFTIFGILIITSVGFQITEIFQWRIEYVALLTGICWGIGSFYGKRGMKKTEISPIVGITVRSGTSLIVLVIAVFSLGPILLNSYFIKEMGWIFTNELGQFFLIIIFEGVLAGFAGMLFYYTAIKKGELSLVMPLAFSSPFWGTALALIFGTEIFTPYRLAGMLFIIYGIMLIPSPNFHKPVQINNEKITYHLLKKNNMKDKEDSS